MEEKREGERKAGVCVYVYILYRVVRAGLIGWHRQIFESLRN